jgi:uncharacterized protein (TIGR00369 family)
MTHPANDQPASDQPDADLLGRVAREQPPFAEWLGVRIVSATPDEVVAEIEASEALGNRNGVLHGGAILGFADNLGGTATFLNLKPGETTTTIESKTNFLRSVPIGDRVRATSTAIHKGRRTMVWQTKITRGDGKLVALVTQTQMIMAARD